jgi:hypothetical protein
MEHRPISELMLRATWNEALKRVNGDKPGKVGLLQNGAVSGLVRLPGRYLNEFQGLVYSL